MGHARRRTLWEPARSGRHVNARFGIGLACRRLSIQPRTVEPVLVTGSQLVDGCKSRHLHHRSSKFVHVGTPPKLLMVLRGVLPSEDLGLVDSSSYEPIASAYGVADESDGCDGARGPQALRGSNRPMRLPIVAAVAPSSEVGSSGLPPDPHGCGSRRSLRVVVPREVTALRGSGSSRVHASAS